MAVPNNSSISAEHRRHDRLLVARFAAGDATGNQAHEAQDLVRRCSECAALAADISVISRSVAQLPAPPRRRDFRLTAQEADHLRGSRFDRWLRTITGSGWATVRPVAAVALSVGLVMSVVGGLPLLNAVGGAHTTDSGSFTVAVVPTNAAAPEATSDTRTGGPVAMATPPVPGVSVDVPVTPPSAGGSDLGVASMGGSTSKAPVGGATDTPASDSLDNAYLQQPTAAPGGQNNTLSGHPGATPSSANEITTPLPTAAPNSGPSALLLIAGLAVTLIALVALALLYTARRRYYDPLLR